ncbi:Clavaminate synthase-like protein [Violaceomyces palustris]|uniref:Clavaminate synthase-like protein n=1 Tax=Violaceomyces palustris TaxID=1673888 RepID=A0ACD0NRZ1_9BASI|nr:Clavaminate synthase-like protein [Violaceomyces palustris]
MSLPPSPAPTASPPSNKRSEFATSSTNLGSNDRNERKKRARFEDEGQVIDHRSPPSSLGLKPRRKTGDGRGKSSHLNRPHPLGVKPMGNSFFSTRNDRASTFGLLARLDDDLIIHIISLLLDPCRINGNTTILSGDPSLLTSKRGIQLIRDLVNLESTSKGFHVLVNSLNSIWRDLVLSFGYGDRLERWSGSWKSTFIYHWSKDVGTPDLTKPWRASCLRENPHLFSDTLYHPFRLATTPLEKYLVADMESPHYKAGKTCAIPVLDVSVRGSEVTFRREFAESNRPVILKNAMPEGEWKCRSWSLDELASRWKGRTFRAEAVRMEIGCYLDYSRSMERLSSGKVGSLFEDREEEELNDQDVSQDSLENSEGWSTFQPNAIPDESPYYLFDSTFAEDEEASKEWKVPEILVNSCRTEEDDASTSVLAGGEEGRGGSTRRSASSDAEVRSDLFSLLGDQRPDHRWIIAGPKRSGSGWHKDPNGTSAWNAVLGGRKYWMMLPPDKVPPGVFVSEDEAEVTAPLSIAEWLIGFVDETRRRLGPGGTEIEVGGEPQLLEGVCEEGQVVYVPSGWWHLVVNLEESVALTQNLVSPPELGKVLDFMKNKLDQTSGFKRRSSNPTRTETNDDEGGHVGIYLDFVERLKLFDERLLREGLEELYRIERRREEEEESSRSIQRVLNKRRRNEFETGRGRFWERLKRGSDVKEVPESIGKVSEDKDLPEIGSNLFASVVEQQDGLDEIPW